MKNIGIIKVNDKIIQYKFNHHNIKILDSYKIKSKLEMAKIIQKVIYMCPYDDCIDRTIKKYVREWRTHNILYHIPLKFFKDHCKDCDFTKNESKFRLFIYEILGRF